MGEMHENITPRQLCKMTSTDEDTMRIRFAKLRKTNPVLFPSPWRIEGELTPDQIKALIQAGQRKGGAPKEDTESAAAFAANIVMRTEQGRSNEAAPQGSGRRWPLWIVLVATVAASAANMAEVTGAVKSGSTSAMLWTFVFSATPFFLIYARIGGFWKWFSIIGAMAYTGFCNAIALFGSMTAMDKGYILSPTIFLEAVTNFANTDYMNTARTLSLIMAIIIAGIEFAAFKNLAK